MKFRVLFISFDIGIHFDDSTILSYLFLWIFDESKASIIVDCAALLYNKTLLNKRLYNLDKEKWIIHVNVCFRFCFGVKAT